MVAGTGPTSAVIRAGEIQASEAPPERKDAEIDHLLTGFVDSYVRPIAHAFAYSVKLEVDKPVIKYLKLTKGSKRIDLFVKPGVVYAYYLLGGEVVSSGGRAYERRVDLTSPQSSLRAILSDFDRIEEELKDHERPEVTPDLARRLGRGPEGLVDS